MKPYYADAGCTLYRANALDLPLEDESVDLVVTSPPYFGLRSYTDNGSHYAGQIGAEATPAEFVDALIAATREMVRVLKPSGSIWVNLGDKYASGGRGTYDLDPGMREVAVSRPRDGARPKSLLGVPWRYALRCIDDLGLILRAEVIWSKPNGLPESVTDRVRRSHEQWFWFQQSGGVESAAERFPFCPLCGRPVDARTTLVARLQELNGGVVPSHLSDEVRSDEGIEQEASDATDHNVAVGSGRTAVPSMTERDSRRVKDPHALVEDRGVSVVDGHPQRGAVGAAVGEADGSLTVDDAREPTEFCACVGHPLIIDDEPWIPQSLAAEIMQSVADGETDPQQAADFLSGDYARNHSVWFHFTRQPRYFSAVDEVREEHVEPRLPDPTRGNGYERHMSGRMNGAVQNPLGKLPGSVWSIPTQPLRVPDHLGVDHFAAFPMEWPRRIIKGWSPGGVCVECGDGRRPVARQVDEDYARARAAVTLSTPRDAMMGGGRSTGSGASSLISNGVVRPSYAVTGYACSCPEPTAPTRPAVVLDPFGGTGTTALVAKALGRHGISVDLSADYCRLAKWRVTDPGELARALEVEKPPTVMDDQGDLLEGLLA